MFAFDSVLIGIVVVGVVCMAVAYKLSRSRGTGTAMASLMSGVFFGVTLLAAIAYRLTIGPGL